jgi:predicted TIM-barrel fold metal-dependent hydrolase
VIDPAAVTAIDVHVHTELTRDGHDPMPPPLREAAARYFKSTAPLPTVDDVAEYYRERNLAAVLFTVDWESRSGIAPIPNEEILDAAAQNPDVIIPFVSVDPARPDALDRARELVAAGAKGFKFHPNLQAFFPNEERVYPLYEAIADAGLPALFHSGHSGIGTGVAGGGGLRLKYSNPMCLERSRSACTRTTCGSTSPAGRRSTSRRSSSSTRTRSCGTRSSSAPTSR